MQAAYTVARVFPARRLTVAVIYRPTHERQIKPSDPFGRYNCAAVAAAIAFDRATIGGVMLNGEDVRALTNEPHPDPASPGLNIPQLVAVGAKLHISLTSVRGGTFDRLSGYLSDGRGVILAGEGSALGVDTCQPGFVGGHALFLNNLNTPGTSILAYNPLCPNYRYLAVNTIRRYAEAFGAAHGGLQYAYTRVTPNIPAQIN